jgi:hypothetical protein
MHPRSRRSPLLDTVFQVTKSGESSTEDRVVALLASLMPLGVELALWRLEELPVEGEGARRRDIAAGFAPGGERASTSAGTSRGSVVMGSSVYLDQRASTSGRERPRRFSRLAERLSKQYAQWAWVAIVR